MTHGGFLFSLGKSWTSRKRWRAWHPWKPRTTWTSRTTRTWRGQCSGHFCHRVSTTLYSLDFNPQLSSFSTRSLICDECRQYYYYCCCYEFTWLRFSVFCPHSELCCSDGRRFWWEVWRSSDGSDAGTNGTTDCFICYFYLFMFNYLQWHLKSTNLKR